jgi:hypothetical protein
VAFIALLILMEEHLTPALPFSLASSSRPDGNFAVSTKEALRSFASPESHPYYSPYFLRDAERLLLMLRMAS